MMSLLNTHIIFPLHMPENNKLKKCFSCSLSTTSGPKRKTPQNHNNTQMINFESHGYPLLTLTHRLENQIPIYTLKNETTRKLRLIVVNSNEKETEDSDDEENEFQPTPWLDRNQSTSDETLQPLLKTIFLGEATVKIEESVEPNDTVQKQSEQLKEEYFDSDKTKPRSDFLLAEFCRKNDRPFIDLFQLHPKQLLPSKESSFATLTRITNLIPKLPKKTDDDFTTMVSQLDRLQQGKTGCCYFCCALISLLNSFIKMNPNNTAKNDEESWKRFLDLFFILEECDPHLGIYVCRIFDHRETTMEWKKIIVDDYLVFDSHRNKLVFSRLEGEEMTTKTTTVSILSCFWVSLVEKAYVKFILSLGGEKASVGDTDAYEAIRRGSFSTAVYHLTGVPCESIKSKLFPQSESGSDDEKEEQESESTWNTVARGVNDGTLLLNLCCSTKHNVDMTTEIRQTGLKIGHAFAVIGFEGTSVILRDPAASLSKKLRLKKLLCADAFLKTTFCFSLEEMKKRIGSGAFFWRGSSWMSRSVFDPMLKLLSRSAAQDGEELALPFCRCMVHFHQTSPLSAVKLVCSSGSVHGSSSKFQRREDIFLQVEEGTGLRKLKAQKMKQDKEKVNLMLVSIFAV